MRCAHRSVADAATRFHRTCRYGRSLPCRSIPIKLAARIGGIVLARWLRGVIIHWRTSSHHLSAIATPFRLPCALAQAACALPTPNPAAAHCGETAGAAGPGTTRLNRNPHGSGRCYPPLDSGGSFAAISNNSIANGHRIAKGRHAGSATRFDNNAPIPIEIAACKTWPGST